MSLNKVLGAVALITMLSLGQAQQELPFNIQIAKAKTPSLVNMFVDYSPIPKSDLVVSSAITPSTFDLNDSGNLIYYNNNEIAIRGAAASTANVTGIFFQDTVTSAALVCSIATTNGPVLCHSGKYTTFAACKYNSTAYEFLLAKKTGTLKQGCERVTLKASTAG